MFKHSSTQVDCSTIFRQSSPDGHRGDVLDAVHKNSTSHVRRLTYKCDNKVDIADRKALTGIIQTSSNDEINSPQNSTLHVANIVL